MQPVQDQSSRLRNQLAAAHQQLQDVKAWVSTYSQNFRPAGGVHEPELGLFDQSCAVIPSGKSGFSPISPYEATDDDGVAGNLRPAHLPVQDAGNLLHRYSSNSTQFSSEGDACIEDCGHFIPGRELMETQQHIFSCGTALPSIMNPGQVHLPGSNSTGTANMTAAVCNNAPVKHPNPHSYPSTVARQPVPEAESQPRPVTVPIHIDKRVFGIFDMELFSRREDCVLHNGVYISQSHFEQLGGKGNIKKWHLSIKVVDQDCSLGAWLRSHDIAFVAGPRPRKVVKAARGERNS